MMSELTTRSFRPSNDWELRHLPLLNSVIFGYRAYDEYPRYMRDRLMARFDEACEHCHCPNDYRSAIFGILTRRCNFVAASMDYYVSISCLHKWRRRVIVQIARLIVSDAALGYDL